MRVLIAGASGAIGRSLVCRLRANQHEVFALTQSRDSAAVLKEIGAEAPEASWGGRCPGLADYVREPEGHLGGDRRVPTC
jgi:nucleoside-diphosphate-sugar epimerase